MKASEIKSRLEEKVHDLEREKETLLQEVQELREVNELNEKASSLESEVNKLKEEAKSLKQQIPPSLLAMVEAESEITEKEVSVRKPKKSEPYTFDDEEGECEAL